LTNAPAPGISGADGGFDPAFNRMVIRGRRGGSRWATAILFFDANGAGAPPRWSLLPHAAAQRAPGLASAYDARTSPHRLGGDTSINTPSLLNDVWVLTVNVANDAVSAVDDRPRRATDNQRFCCAPTPNPTTGRWRDRRDGRQARSGASTRGRRAGAVDGELPADLPVCWDGRDDAGPACGRALFCAAWTVAGSVARRWSWYRELVRPAQLEF
jgi:hypothetical protein